MSHPKNKGERNYQKKFQKEKIKKRYSNNEYRWSNTEWPVYSANRGSNWRSLPLDCDFNSPFYHNYRHMNGVYSNEPFYIAYSNISEIRRYGKKIARRQVRRYKHFLGGKKDNSYKKVFDYAWLIT